MSPAVSIMRFKSDAHYVRVGEFETVSDASGIAERLELAYAAMEWSWLFIARPPKWPDILTMIGKLCRPERASCDSPCQTANEQKRAAENRIAGICSQLNVRDLLPRHKGKQRIFPWNRDGSVSSVADLAGCGNLCPVARTSDPLRLVCVAPEPQP